MLALGISRRTMSNFLGALSYGQAAPPGFVLLVRMTTALFGESERVFRAVSLVAGLVSLPLFASVAHRLLSKPATLVALAAFAILEPMIYYSNELKPYGVDLAIALLILDAVLRSLDRRVSAKRGSVYAVAGSI